MDSSKYVVIDRSLLTELQFRLSQLEKHLQDDNCASRRNLSIVRDKTSTNSQSPQLRYGHITAPQFLQAYAATLKDSDIALRSERRNMSFEGKIINHIMGSNHKHRQGSIMPARSRETGYTDYFFLHHFHQPYIPTEPGERGIFVSALPPTNSAPKYEKVFVSASPGTRSVTEYVYMGEYEFIQRGPLTAQEVATLNPAILDYWARYVKDVRANYPWAARARSRIAYRKSRGDEPSAEQLTAWIHADPGMEYKLSIRDVLQAFKNGDEKLYANGMQCVWYEPSFQMRLIAEKEQGGNDVSYAQSTSHVSHQTRKRRRLTEPQEDIIFDLDDSDEGENV